MMRRSRAPRLRSTLGAAALVSALVLSGCSSSPGTPGASTPASDGTLVVGAASGIPQLNPAIRTFAFEETLFPLLWTGLTQWNAAGEIVPDLATSWTSNDDATEWTFTLAEGATYSDGTPLDAQAVADVFAYYLDPNTATQEANKLATIDSVTAADDTTVVIALNAANAFLPESVTGVRMIKVDNVDDINSDTVTSGPYVVSEFTPDSTLTMTANDAYWGGEPAVEEIDLVKTADTTAATTGLRSGDLDVLINVAQSDVATLEAEPNLAIHTPEVLSQAVTWEMDLTSAPFDDVRARQALAYATDREAILAAAYYGQGAVSTTNTMLADTNPYKSGALTEYPYDLDKAKELFAEAGVTEGDTLVWWSSSAFAEQAAAGQILQASLAEIGITLEIQANDTATWADKFYPAGKSYPGYIIANFQSVPSSPAFSMNFLLEGRCECNWNSVAYDSAFASALATPAGDAQQAYWDTAQKLENEEVPLITPLIAAPAVASAASVTGIWIEGGGQVHLESAAIE
ncbi:ABC transporter substrate-binding protein [Microbacterium sp.]|uniref:ABC transporter substrate-binding protein n=1 Tax=Microbacterium sp. TaxID=51671 RepID=UPI0039E5835F